MRTGLISAVALVLALVGALPAAAATSEAATTPITITGVDLHDGMMLKSGSTYYLYGTRYGCGFEWTVKKTPWCGFGVSTAGSQDGPWSAPKPLFATTARSPFAGMTWQQLCGDTGNGCFNARMIQRRGWGLDDGAWILWFNAPADFARSRANAYYALTCTGPAGPCGQEAGGSTIKPALRRCGGNGDFSLVLDLPRPPMMLCTMSDQTLSSERLTAAGTGGTGEGAARLAGMTGTEGPGAYRDASGTWVLTFNEQNCGYCTGTGTSYATATSVNGPWSSPTTIGFGGPPSGHRQISGTSCGGQGRTVVTLDGQAYELIDLWLGTRNEAGAGIHLEPLTYRGPSPAGRPWAPFVTWTCQAA